MSLTERILFNILFNSLFSFIAGLMIVLAAIKILRVGDGRLKIYLLSLPFLKLMADVLRGIPSDSYVWSQLDVLALPREIGRWLSVDLGFAEFGPIISVKLSIGDAVTKVHSLSIADITYAWLLKLGGGRIVFATLCFCLAIASGLAVLRIAKWVHFERQRRQDRASPNAEALEVAVLGRRKVDVYQTQTYAGTPFTGGLFKPYICFPAQTLAILSPAERQAVTRHELAHVRQWDIAQTLVIHLLGNIFWFVPFYRYLSHKIDKCRELVADQMAVRMGAEPLMLAAALIKLGEAFVSPPKSALYSAFLKRRSLLAIRVKALTEASTVIPKQTRSWQRVSLRMVGVAWITGIVFSATLGGNYQIEQPSEVSRFLSELVARWLSLLSIM